MSEKYDLYLQKHRENVLKGFDWISEHIMTMPESVCERVMNHDQSKDELDEYAAYDDYFYGDGQQSETVKKLFNAAWLRHIHKNPHHWQHWVLHNDNPEEGVIAIDMPLSDIIEMICDWWSFSWGRGNLYEIFDWYEKHSSYMILSESTRSMVDFLLKLIKAKLDAEGENGECEKV